MKKFTLLFSFLLLIVTTSLFAQKVVVVGINHETPDGFSFVATESIPVNEIIYFTDNEYSDALNAFTFNGQPTGEVVVKFTVTSALSSGDVVFVKETSANVLTVSGSGGTGTATVSTLAGNAGFSLSPGGEGLYAYSDTDENSTNGISQIYSVMYTGSGEAPVQNGGNIPGDANPAGDYPNAVVVDGFPDDADDFAGILRVEYKFSPATLRNAVSKTALENPVNYLSYAVAQDLSIVPFTNLNLGGANPVLTVSASPASLNENSDGSITYTFTLSSNASSNITVNFSVGGTATFTSDYTQTGAASFNASSGTVTISSGTNSASVTVTPVGDTNLEPDETVILTLTSGTGYDAGSPSSATGTILNDDTQTVTPLVAVTGVNQNDPEGFSFVALDDISSGTTVYFTENSFENSSLTFPGSEAVLSWTAPVAGVLRGEVIVVKENPANTFTAVSNSGNSGTISLISGTLSFASAGEGFFVYTDSDNNPLNGITEIYSVLYTGNSTTSGENIPASEDPSLVYTGAVVVDGFAATAPDRTEYDPTKRNVTVDNANFQNVGNWLHGLANQDLSVVPFTNIIVTTGSANPTVTVAVSPSNVIEDSGDTLFYTFTMSAPASGNITVNFNVAGTADFSTDYTVDGANTFTSSTGSIVIAEGATTAVLAVVPVSDTNVEIQESVQITFSSGTGYDGGSPNDAIGTISNDDTRASDPLVAITGLNHLDPDGFSFVAAQDVPASTIIYFTDNSFNKNTLVFSSGESVLSWTSPASIVPAGQVFVVNETSPDVFAITRSGGSIATGNISVVTGGFAIATNGESFYAYKDNDNNPGNGIEDIYAALFTGDASISGGVIPALEDPSGIYTHALVVDDFTATAPNRTEYDPSKRNVLVENVDFENVNNWLHAQTNQTLSTVPFDSLDIVVHYNIDPSMTGLPASITVVEDVSPGYLSNALSDATFADSDAGANNVTLTLTVSSGAVGFANPLGLIGISGNATNNAILTGTVSNIESYLSINTNVHYIPPGNVNGSNAATLTITANDGGNTGVGGGIDVTLGTVNIDITAVNDDPEMTGIPTDITVVENTVSDVDLSTATLTDVDASVNSITFTLTAAQGILSATSGGGVTVSGSGTATLTLSGSVSNIDTYLNTASFIQYTGPVALVGDNATTLSLKANDGGNTGTGGGTDVVLGTVNVDIISYPVVTSVSVPANGTYIAGQNLDFTINFDKNVTVNSAGGTPQLSLTIGATPQQANYMSGSGSSALVFRYTVQSGDLDTDGITVGNLSANGGTLQDASGNDAVLTLNSVGSTAAVLVDAVAPAAPSTPDLAAGSDTGDSDTDNLTAATKPTFTGTAEANSTVTIISSVDGTLGTTTTNGSGNWTFASGTMTEATHNITATATDAAGNTGSASSALSITIDKSVGSPINADFTASPKTACSLPHTVFFTDQSILPDTWHWTFGDGGTSTAQNPIHTYTSAGQFIVQLTIIDTMLGISDSFNDTINISLATADFTGSAIFGCGPLTVNFTDNSTVSGVESISGWSWDFGDGNSSTQQSPDHTYDSPGVYTVSLTVSLPSGCTNTKTRTNYVQVIGPNVDYSTTSVTETCPPAIVEFKDETTTSSPTTSWSWNFGDGTTSTLQNPIHTFSTYDTFDVSLTVTDLDGCSRTITKNNFISTLDTISPTAVCKNINVYLDETGNVSKVAADLDGGSTDNCSIDTMWLDKYVFTCSDLGDNTVSLYIADASGNVDSCQATLTVEDTISPSAVCKDISVGLDQNGNITFSASQFDGGSSDNCSIDTMWLNRYDFTVADFGINTVTLTVEDASGNRDSCTANVKIGDFLPPVVQCNFIGIELDDDGNHTFTDEELQALAAGTTDNFSSPEDLIIEASIMKGVTTCNGGGIFVFAIVTATDENGNSDSCSRWLKILNAFDLIVKNIEDISINIPAGACETTIAYPAVDIKNTCTELKQIEGLGLNGKFPVGNTEEVWLLSNSSGDSLVFSFNVTVTAENLPPTLDPISDIDTAGNVVELTIPLTGISYGADCAEQELTVNASGVNVDVVSNIMIDYTSPDSTGQLVLSIPSGVNGSDTITVTVEDSEGSSVSHSFVVSFNYSNTSPELGTPVSDQELIADQVLEIPFNDSIFVDVDGDTLSIVFSLEDGSNLPSWISYSNDTLYLMPSISDTGCISVVVTATDPSMQSVSDTFNVCVKSIPVGINDTEINQLHLSMYPNPSKGYVALEFDKPVTGNIQLMVSDIAGKRILQKTFIAAQQIDFNLANQVPGMYFVNIQVDGRKYMKKLILNKE